MIKNFKKLNFTNHQRYEKYCGFENVWHLPMPKMGVENRPKCTGIYS